MIPKIINYYIISWILIYLCPESGAVTKYACITAGGDSSSGEYDSSSSEELYDTGNALYGAGPGFGRRLLRGSLSCVNTPQTSILITKYIHGNGGYARCASPNEDCDDMRFSDPEITPMCDGQAHCRIHAWTRHLQKCGISSNFIHVEYECVYSWSLFDICKDTSTVVHDSSVFVASPNFFQSRQGQRNYHICECIAKSLYDDQVMLQYIHTDLLAGGGGQCKGNSVLIESKINSTQSNVDKRTEICGKRTLTNQLHRGTIRITYTVDSDSDEEGFLTKLLARDMGPGNSAKIGVECGPVPDVFANESVSMSKDSQNSDSTQKKITSTTPVPSRQTNFQNPGNQNSFGPSNQNPGNQNSFGPSNQNPSNQNSFGPSNQNPGNQNSFGPSNQNPGNQNSFGPSNQNPGSQDFFGPSNQQQPFNGPPTNPRFGPFAPPSRFGPAPRIPPPPSFDSRDMPPQNSWDIQGNNQNNIGNRGPPPTSSNTGPPQMNRPDFTGPSMPQPGSSFNGPTRGPSFSRNRGGPNSTTPPPPREWRWRWGRRPPAPPSPWGPRNPVTPANRPVRNFDRFAPATPRFRGNERPSQNQGPPRMQNSGSRGSQGPSTLNMNIPLAEERMTTTPFVPPPEGAAGNTADQAGPAPNGIEFIGNKPSNTESTTTVEGLPVSGTGEGPPAAGTGEGPPAAGPLPSPPVVTERTSAAPVAAAAASVKKDETNLRGNETGRLVGYIMGGVGAVLSAVCGLIITFMCSRRRKRNRSAERESRNQTGSDAEDDTCNIPIYTLPTTFEYSHPSARSCSTHDNAAYVESDSSVASVRSDLSGSFESININDLDETEDLYHTLSDATEGKSNEEAPKPREDEGREKVAGQCQTELNLRVRISNDEVVYDNNTNTI